MDIGSVLGVQGSGDTSLTGATGSSELGRDEFLKLLLTQLQMQDPLNPMDNGEMIAQLAQFSSLEQMEDINTSLKGNLEMDLLLGQLLNNTMSTTLIGRAVRAETSSFSLEEGKSVSLGYRLSADAAKVSATILDADGIPVATIDGLDGAEGYAEFSWDGRDDDGNRVAPGAYSFSINAVDEKGNAIEADETLMGVVDGVRYRDGNALLLIGATEVLMSSVLEIHDEL
jgi:flagellar basal-body rod modification protein FlgD